MALPNKNNKGNKMSKEVKDNLSVRSCAAEMGYTTAEYSTILNHVGGTIKTNEFDHRKVKNIVKDPIHCNILHFVTENSKTIGTLAENAIRHNLKLSNPRNIHHDATVDNIRIEIKTISALGKPDKRKTYMERVLYICEGGLNKVRGIFQHTKPLELDVLIGVTIFMDGVAIYMLEADKINPSTNPNDINDYQVTMGAQQAGHPTEGTLTPDKLKLIAVIEGTPLCDITLTYQQLVEAYETDAIITEGNTKEIIRPHEKLYGLISF